MKYAPINPSPRPATADALRRDEVILERLDQSAPPAIALGILLGDARGKTKISAGIALSKGSAQDIGASESGRGWS